MSVFLFDPYWKTKLKFGAALIVAAIPSGALLFLLYEICGFRESWIWYVTGCAFYSVAVFVYAYIEDESTLLSSEDD